MDVRQFQQQVQTMSNVCYTEIVEKFRKIRNHEFICRRPRSKLYLVVRF